MFDDSNLRSLQLIELKILLEVKRICEQYNIKYFLIGGTLLGVVRHQGFIPWDDDIDIGMLRSDYNQFVDIFKKISPPGFSLETYDSDKGWMHVFGKVRLNNTEYRDPITGHVLENNGICIDVFPFDNFPEAKHTQYLHLLSLRIHDKILGIKYRYYIPSSGKCIDKIYQSLCGVLSKILPISLLLKSREYVLQKYNNRPTSNIINWSFKVTKSEYFDELLQLPFETVLFPVPKMYHEYLTSFYGDYMKLPPENERLKHSPYEPDFGEYAYIKTLDDVLPKKE